MKFISLKVVNLTTSGEKMPINKEYVRNVEHLLLEDKLMLSPIIFEGIMVSRTNTYKGLYFVSFKVIQVIKGRLSTQLQGHIRLLFQSNQIYFNSLRSSLRMNACPPIPFRARTGRRYLVFVKV